MRLRLQPFLGLQGSPHLPVLDDILSVNVSVCLQCMMPDVTYDTADTVLLSKSIEQFEQFQGISCGLLGRDNLDGNALLEVDGDVQWCVRGGEGADSASPTYRDQQCELSTLPRVSRLTTCLQEGWCWGPRACRPSPVSYIPKVGLLVAYLIRAMRQIVVHGVLLLHQQKFIFRRCCVRRLTGLALVEVTGMPGENLAWVESRRMPRIWDTLLSGVVKEVVASLEGK